MSRVRILCCLLAASVAAIAQPARSVDQLISFIKSAIQLKQDDRKVAEEVARIRLSSRLEKSTVDDLQRLGAGPKTVAALAKLVEATTSLPVAVTAPPPAPVVVPPPEPAELNRILAEIRQNALDYTKNLPNYICAQETRRHVDPTGTGNYRLADRILEKLTFFEQKEDYKVISINDRPVTNGVQHNQLGGAKSSGEFGSILHTIFDPEAQAEFQWERWATLPAGRAYVFAFRVRQPRYGIEHGESKRSISVGFHGLIFADRDTKTVRRIQMECDGIPADFPIQSVTLALDYDTFEIAGQKFVLPLKSEIRSREGTYLSWNEVGYHNYNKFGADASITFDTPEDNPPVKKK
ncbi:MAG TPA: hypothetical protein VE959_23040 [Bryobacteraceae bacterium]|nr:hypothetical protein [Bryobacteraceae bacterium]